METYKPKELRKFWYVTFYGVQSDYFEHNKLFPALCYHAGNCFKTKEDALKNADEIRNRVFYK